MVSLPPGIQRLLVAYEGLAAQQVRVIAAQYPLLKQAHYDAEHVAREALLEAAETFTDDVARFASYAKRVINHRLVESLARRAGHLERGPAADAALAELSARAEADCETLYDRLDRLPRKMRKLITLRFGLEGRSLTVEQLVGRLKLPKRIVVERIEAAIKSLRDMID